MGIKLEWQVESEQAELRAQEDPDARRRRRVAQRRFILLLIAISSLVCLAVSLAYWRLQRLDAQYRQDLIDTVEAEVAALRVGDRDAFMRIQRSRSDAFLADQARAFDTYQALKQAHRVQLTGEVLDVAIDDLTGRVVVQEIIDGVPYKVVWFYWYYKDDGSGEPTGWRRVPDNLAFWGEERTFSTEHVRVRYQALDEELALALGPRLDDWWTRGCALLGCAQPPPALHLDIVARHPAPPTWSNADPWTLVVTSPLVTRARADVALPADLEHEIREQVAGRLVRHAAGDRAFSPASDPAWVVSELARWLGNRLIALDTAPAPDPTFVGQLVAQYGAGAIPALVGALNGEPPVDTLIQAVSGVSLAQMGIDQLNRLDWRGFFQWRVQLEHDLLTQPDGSGLFLMLYDLERADATANANLRLEDPRYAAQTVPQVMSVGLTRDDHGQLFAVVELVHNRQGEPVTETAFWRLAGGTWKRVS